MTADGLFSGFALPSRSPITTRAALWPGAPITPLRIHAAPIAALDLGGRGVVHLVSSAPDELVLSEHGPCLPGAVLWLPMRGDLWRSGTLGEGGLPVGPRL